MIIPTCNGRKMKLVKAYPSHVLFEDEKTGIRESFTNHELGIHTEQIREEELKQYRREVRYIQVAV